MSRTLRNSCERRQVPVSSRGKNEPAEEVYGFLEHVEKLEEYKDYDDEMLVSYK